MVPVVKSVNQSHLSKKAFLKFKLVPKSDSVLNSGTAQPMKSPKMCQVMSSANRRRRFSAPCLTRFQLEICRKIISKWKLNELEDQKSVVIRIVGIITAIIGKIVGQTHGPSFCLSCVYTGELLTSCHLYISSFYHCLFVLVEQKLVN